MIQNKTRVRLTWAFMLLCFIGMIFGVILKEAGVIIASLASASPVVMMYIGGKTLDNKSKIEKNETKN